MTISTSYNDANPISLDAAFGSDFETPSEHAWFATIEKFVGDQSQPTPFIWAGRIINSVNMLSTLMAGKLAHKLWFTPQSRPINKEDRQFLLDAEQYKIAFKGQNIPIYEWGHGQTVLMVHGWGGHAGQFRQMAQALVANGFQVISFDAPGHGFAEGKTTTVEDISTIIQMLSKQYRIKGIVSHSIGGLASHDALASNMGCAFHVVLNTPISLRHITHTFKHQLSLPSEVIDQLSHQLEKRFGEDVWHRFDLRNRPTPDNKFTYQQFFSYDDMDHQVPPEVSHFLQALYPEAEHVPTKQLGHNKPVRNKDVIQAVIRFIQPLG